MITGAHTIIYASDANAARAFFRDVLGFPSVDAGEGWLIFGLPPAELAAHPLEGGEAGRHELFLMCDDIRRTVEELRGKGVEFTSDVTDQGWGLLTSLRIPGGGEISLYEPRHLRPSHAAALTSGSRKRVAARRKRPRTPVRKPAKRKTRRDRRR